MAVTNPPIWIQSGGETAELARRFTHAVLHSSSGVMDGGDLKVAENGTPNMSVNVAAGRARINGTESSFQGAYFVESRSTENLAVAAADPTNPRKDLVVAKVQDAAYSGVTNAWSLAVVTGTPAPSPAEPATPANSMVLAMIDVPALDTAITNSQITERRVLHPLIAAPRGRIDYKQVTADQGSITTVVDLTGLTITFTAVTGRRYRVLAFADFTSDTANDIPRLILADGSNAILKTGRNTVPAASNQISNSLGYANNANISGSTTWKLRAVRNAGASTVTMKAASDNPAFILIEDIGGVLT